MLRLRVFVSSPGDVGDERRIAVRVLRRVQARYASVLTVEPIVWEHEPVRATATFQDQISSPADCDLVICVLWSRLGTRLAAEYRRPDGTIYDSGTAFEFETAQTAFDRQGRPDLLVYRKTAPPIVDIRDRETRERASEEWDRLVAYLDGWFRNPDGSFRAGFTTFERPDEFEELLERHFERLVQNRLARENDTDEARSATAPAWLQGSPFRGLEVFDVHHEEIFHGRARQVAEVGDRLRRRALDGTAFLLVYGMSGSGKSSLVRAGVLPTITEPGVIEGVGLWRYAIVRPSEGPTPVHALLNSLSAASALPELAEADFTSDELAPVLAESAERIAGPLRKALDRAALKLQQAERLARPPAARIALVVDQLEELFTDARIDASARETFVAVLGSLARSGLAWVICTMRSDFFHRCADVPALARLKDGLGSYELLPPQGAELTRIIRDPAGAGGLRFEDHPERGRLDDVIHQAASRDPASLPLLEFTLQALYEASGDRRVLTFAAYDDLGGLEGAIAGRAETVLGSLPRDVKDALGGVILSLVTIQHEEGKATARATPRRQVCATRQRERLADALVDARLLVADGEGGEAMIRVAHEALLHSWPLAAAIISANRDDLLVRDRVRRDAAVWHERGREPDLLLPAGRRLAEAVDLLARLPDEFDERSRAYVAASEGAERRRRRRRRLSSVGAFAVLFTLLCLVAWFAATSERQRARAEANLDSAIDAAVSLTLELGEQFSNSAGTQRNTILAIQDQALALLARLAETQDVTPTGRRARAVSLAMSSRTLAQSGNHEAALSTAEVAVLEMQAVADADPANAAVQYDLARALEVLGDHRATTGDRDGGLSHYSAALEIYDRLAGVDPPPAGLQRRIADLWRVTGQLQPDSDKAIDAFQRSLAVLEDMPPEDRDAAAAKGSRASTELALADLHARRSDMVAAEQGYRAAVEIRRMLAATDSHNVWYAGLLASALRSLGQALGRRGALDEALAYLEEAARIDSRLYMLDPENIGAGGSLAATRLAEAELMEAAGDIAGAQAKYAYGAALAEELIAKGHRDSRFKLLLASALMKWASLEQRAGRTEEAGERLRRAHAIALTIEPPDPLAATAERIVRALEAHGFAAP